MKPMMPYRPALIILAFLAAVALSAHNRKVSALVDQPGSPAWVPLGAVIKPDWPVISGDGRLVAYLALPSSSERSLSANAPQVWVEDRQAGTRERVSAGSAGEPANSWSYRVAISGDGRFVAFTSLANNLVQGDTNGMADIFVHDLLTGATERITIAYGGGEANGWSDWPALSRDGRYVAFASSASNLVLGDTGAQVDVFLHDRLTHQTTRVPLAEEPGQLAGQAGWATAVSGDGRLVAYLARAGRATTDTAPNPYRLNIYNQITRTTQLIEPQSALPGTGWEAGWPSFSGNGRRLAAVFWRRAPSPQPEARVVVYDLLAQQAVFLQPIASDPGGGGLVDVRVGLSADGSTVAIVSPGSSPQARPDGTQATLTIYDVETGAALPQASGQAGSQENLRAGRAPGLSADGRTLVVAADRTPNPGEPDPLSGGPVVVELDPHPSNHYHIGGRVTLPGGWPLASATISVSGGSSARTDRLGFFYLSGLAPGDYRLSASKEGYAFQPEESLLTVSADETALRFSAVPEEILVEARQDLGMPYSFYRGCASPYLGCGGPYHGFEAGYCTDLVLDAYSWGLDFHIQYALDRDARAHPGHFYRWGNARNSHDMWRYFHYTGQVLTHQEPYQPGDIVFFDWERDGMMDHVALIAEVNPSGRPLKLLDATGVIDSNPSGLAAELPWEGFHEGTVWGHARWSGTYGAIREATPPNLEVLQIALDGPGIDLRLVDMLGREFATGSLQADAAADGNPGPQSIPNLQYWDLNSGLVVSLLSPRSTSSAYLVELRAGDDSAYYLNIKSQVGGWTTRYIEPAREFLPQGQVRRMAIILDEENGQPVHQVVALD